MAEKKKMTEKPKKTKTLKGGTKLNKTKLMIRVW